MTGGHGLVLPVYLPAIAAWIVAAVFGTASSQILAAGLDDQDVVFEAHPE